MVRVVRPDRTGSWCEKDDRDGVETGPGVGGSDMSEKWGWFNLSTRLREEARTRVVVPRGLARGDCDTRIEGTRPRVTQDPHGGVKVPSRAPTCTVGDFTVSHIHKGLQGRLGLKGRLRTRTSNRAVGGSTGTTSRSVLGCKKGNEGGM